MTVSVRFAFCEGLTRKELDQRLMMFQAEALAGWNRRKERDAMRKSRWTQRRGAANRGRRESANEWILRKIYTLVRQLKEIGQIVALKRHLKNMPLTYRGAYNIDDQPHKQALSIVLGQRIQTSGPRPLGPEVNREWRSIWGYALGYADRHDIHPSDLRIFVKRVTLKACRRKYVNNEREPAETLDGLRTAIVSA